MDLKRTPRHIAVIMDGNGRWALQKGVERIFGHRNAMKAVRAITEGCGKLGVEFLTLYAFSTENWKRSKREVKGLMDMLTITVKKELPSLIKNEIKLQIVGDMSRLPKACVKNLNEAVEATKQNEKLTLILALSYSGRWEIVETAKAVTREVLSGNLREEDIDEKIFSSYLATVVPDPELLIRTGGEMRISNFLLWQIAYTELYMTKKLWPDFREEDLHEAIQAYQMRKRKFGAVEENVL